MRRLSAHRSSRPESSPALAHILLESASPRGYRRLPRFTIDKRMMPFQKILVPTDFSLQSMNATRLAANLCERYSAALTLLYVHEPVAYELPEGQVANLPSYLDRLFVEFNQRLADARELAWAAGAHRVDTRLLQGSAKREIVRFAASFDLLVMGTRGKQGLDRLLSGSLSEHVVQTAPCAVLVVGLQKAT
jgi:nucleotide-binding universal stress UspA family protein